MTRQDKERLLRRTAADHQKQAWEFLRGRSPGVMQRYAPDARPYPDEGWVESDDTVERLRQWREEAAY